MPHQPDYELRAVAVLDGGSEVVADFSQRESTEQAFFLGVETGKIRQIRLQRRPYDWVEFKGVPTQWSETPIRDLCSAEYLQRCDATCRALDREVQETDNHRTGWRRRRRPLVAARWIAAGQSTVPNSRKRMQSQPISQRWFAGSSCS